MALKEQIVIKQVPGCIKAATNEAIRDAVSLLSSFFFLIALQPNSSQVQFTMSEDNKC